MTTWLSKPHVRDSTYKPVQYDIYMTVVCALNDGRAHRYNLHVGVYKVHNLHVGVYNVYKGLILYS